MGKAEVRTFQADRTTRVMTRGNNETACLQKQEESSLTRPEEMRVRLS